MNVDRAVELVVNKTGWYPINAFEFDDTVYVMVTPLKDYVPGEDVVQCYYPVIGESVGSPINILSLLRSFDDPGPFVNAANNAKDYSNFNT